MSEGVFSGTVEGAISDGILRWLGRNKDILTKKWYLDPECEASVREVYIGMNAVQWLTKNSAVMDSSLASICGHHIFSIFQIGYQIAMLTIRLEGENYE